MLPDFILANVDELAARARARGQQRRAGALELPSDDGVAQLLVQLAARLQGPPGAAPAGAALSIDALASARALELLDGGRAIDHAVHGYSDIFHAVTDLAAERRAGISLEQLRDFGACLAQLVAAAVRAFASAQEQRFAAAELERVGELAHELRNVIATAVLSFEAIKLGAVGTNGSLAAMHTRSLARLRVLVDQALTRVRLDAEVTHFTLLLNAFKFTRPKGHVSINTRLTATRALIDVHDECGGLKVEDPEELFKPFEQRNENRSGLGLGLQIARRAVQVNGGTLEVVDLSPFGCRFTIDLPRL